MKIVIPCTKSSDRFPGKNEKLIGYTMDWLSAVQRSHDYPLEIYILLTAETYNLKDKFLRENLAVTPLHLNDNVKAQAMEPAITAFFENVEVGTHEAVILLQLTQPLRALNLLQMAVKAYIDNNLKCVLSYVRGPEKWRVLDHTGNFNKAARPTGELLKIHDGAIYVFNKTNYLDLWNTNAKASVLNDVAKLVDIDYPTDYNKQEIDELCKQYISF